MLYISYGVVHVVDSLWTNDILSLPHIVLKFLNIGVTSSPKYQNKNENEWHHCHVKFVINVDFFGKISPMSKWHSYILNDAAVINQ